MARPVITEIQEINGFGIQNIYNDDSFDEHIFYEGDIVTDFRFASNNEYVKMTGKIKKVNFNSKRFATRKNVSSDTQVRKIGSLSSIVVDGSTTYESNLKGVDARSILEYQPTKEVKKVSYFPMLKVNLRVILSDESETSAILYEGMILNNVVIQSNGTDYKGNFKLVSFYHEMVGSTIKLAGMYLKGDIGDFKISFYNIKKIGTESIIIEDTSDIEDALHEALTSNKGLSIGSGEIPESLNLTSSITMNGNKMDIAANYGSRKSDEISEDETVLKGKLMFSENSDIVITGFTLTNESLIDLKGAKSVVFRNCKFTDMALANSKNYLINNSVANSEGLLIQIEGCYFGTNNNTSSNNMYNLFELNSKLKDGSYVKNCYFAADVCVHNIINLYDVEDNATIYIENNHFEKSINACRVGFKGAPQNVTVILNNNVYDETDSDPNYAGLLIIQPYGTATTSLGGVTIKINKTKYTNKDNNNTQLFYVWYYPGEPEIRGELAPTVYVDGKLVDLIYPQDQ